MNLRCVASAHPHIVWDPASAGGNKPAVSGRSSFRSACAQCMVLSTFCGVMLALESYENINYHQASGADETTWLHN